MAYGNPNPTSDDSFSDAEVPSSMDQGSEDKSGEKDSGEPTGLLPKSILMGKDFNVGDEVVLRITRIMDDQIEVAYATGEESDKKDSSDGDHEAGKGYSDEMSMPKDDMAEMMS